MKIARLLSWHDEDPAHLESTIRSTAGLCDSIVAVSGRYAHYPEATFYDEHEQVQTIRRVAAELGMDAVIEASTPVWESESAKRSALFEMAHMATEPGDWLLILDGDTEIAPQTDAVSVREFLSDTLAVSASALHVTHQADGRTEPVPLTIAFRRQAQPITVGKAHYQYLVGGEKLWGYGAQDPTPMDLTRELHVDHWNVRRDDARAKASRDYYSVRDKLGLEKQTCELCKHRKAARTVPYTWDLIFDHATGTRGGMATNIECCVPCLPRAQKRSYAGARKIGLNPETMMASLHPTAPPVPLPHFYRPVMA